MGNKGGQVIENGNEVECSTSQHAWLYQGLCFLSKLWYRWPEWWEKPTCLNFCYDGRTTSTGNKRKRSTGRNQSLLVNICKNSLMLLMNFGFWDNNLEPVVLRDITKSFWDVSHLGSSKMQLSHWLTLPQAQQALPLLGSQGMSSSDPRFGDLFSKLHFTSNLGLLNSLKKDHSAYIHEFLRLPYLLLLKNILFLYAMCIMLTFYNVCTLHLCWFSLCHVFGIVRP